MNLLQPVINHKARIGRIVVSLGGQKAQSFPIHSSTLQILCLATPGLTVLTLVTSKNAHETTRHSTFPRATKNIVHPTVLTGSRKGQFVGKTSTEGPFATNSLPPSTPGQYSRDMVLGQRKWIQVVRVGAFATRTAMRNVVLRRVGIDPCRKGSAVFCFIVGVLDGTDLGNDI